jgi:NADP-dependent 3-hydroxy acid dehydrogenase YdfG
LAWDWSRPCSRGGKVTVIARVGDALESVRARLGVVTISADVTDETATHRILAEVRPDILALNTGATPRMSRLDQLSRAVFTAPWEHEVKAVRRSWRATSSGPPPARSPWSWIGTK